MKFYNTVFWAGLLLFFRLSMTVFAQDVGGADPGIDVEEERSRITEEAPEEFLTFSLKDSNVSLFMTGSWSGTLQLNPGYSISPWSHGFTSPETPLLFTQEADLTLSLWMNKKWFVEANFLDDTNPNTYRAGYQGTAGEFVQYAGIGNTGLDFPSFPYLDLGGDSPSSFGFYGRVGGGNVGIHTLFRYDAAVREEKIFYGGRERINSFLDPRNSIRGISFVLPDTNIDSEITVYIEDIKGSILDSGGRRLRAALASEYAVGRTHGLLELNIRADGMIAVVYSSGGINRPWISSMGNYSGASGEFLFEVQQWFDPSRLIDLENYPQCGGNGASSRPGEIMIGGNYALVIREPGTFSPFERQNRYDAPSSATEKAAVVRLSTGNELQDFELVPLDAAAATGDIPLLAAAASQLLIYELLPSGGAGRREPGACWPLAADYPEIYLPGAGNFSGDIGLRFTNYGNAEGFFIGTDVVPTSIQVWRSGIQYNNFIYNDSNGEVKLTGQTSTNELIRITYLKRKEETRLGSIAAGLGVIYHKESSPFTMRTAVGVRWNLTEDSSFTEESLSSPGTVGISAKAAWDYDHLKAHLASGLAFEQADTTGLYRAAGMEGNEIILSLPPETSFLSHPPSSEFVTAINMDTVNRADLTYRNYIDNSVLGFNLMPVSWNGAVIVPDQNRPYPVRDPLFGRDTQVLAGEFVLTDDEKWTGFEVPLGFDSEILSRCSEIEIPFRFYGFDHPSPPDFKLIIQIGSLSDKDFARYENPDLVWERLLFQGDGLAFDTNPRIARFVLTDEDRLKLGDARYLRIIAVNDDPAGAEISGSVLLAPPIVRGAAFRAVTYDGNTVSAVNDFSSGNRVTALETIDTALNTLESVYSDTISRLHPSAETQRVLKIEWENMESGISAGADGRTGELPFADYKALSFFVKGPSITQGTLTFIAANGPDSFSERQLEAHIPLSAFREGQWSKVTIRYSGSDTGISVDGNDVSAAWFRYKPKRGSLEKTAGKSGYAAILINPEGTAALDDANICIDEIIFEDASVFYRINAGAAVEYSKEGTLLSIGRAAVLSDFSVSTAVETEFRADSVDQDAEVQGSVVNRTGAEISVFKAKVSGTLVLTSVEDNFFWGAEQGINWSVEPFSIKETFSASMQENSARRTLNLVFSSPFSLKFDGDALYEFSVLDRKWKLDMDFSPKNKIIPSIAINTQAAWTDRTEDIEINDNYGELWVKTWEFLLPDTGEEADSRRTAIQITITEATKPIGAVVNLEGKTDFSAANNITRLEYSAFLDVPLSLNRSTVNFRAGRGYKRHLYFSGDDALDDGEKFFESISDSLPLWGVFPGYSLFASELNEAMNNGIESSRSCDLAFYTAFNDHFSIKANLPKKFNLWSFLLPSSTGLRIERNLEQKMDTGTDLLNLGASLGFSSINMFGRFGYLPLFKFYQGDEFTHTVEAAVILPENAEDISWRIQSSLGAGFNGFTGGVLNFANTLTIRSGDNFLESLTAGWTVPVKKSLLGVFYNWAAGKTAKKSSWPGLTSLLNSNYQQLRKETLEFSFNKTDAYMRWGITAGHESIIRILGRLNLSAFIKIRCNEDIMNEIYIFDALLGINLRVSF